MLLLDRQSGATAQLRGGENRSGVPAGRVQLRLRADGQVLELLPGKTTVGSSPRCNLRIAQPGVQPLHCLIVDGPEGLRIRSWAANTTLNGVPFEESALSVGDCLSLASVEVEVVDPQAGWSQTAAVEVPAIESKDAEQIRRGRDRARSRSRQLLKSLRRERTAHQELCQQVAKLQESHLDAIAEQNEIDSKLESTFAELAVARRQLGEYESVEAARQELAQRNEQLEFQIGELSAQINELTREQTEVAKDRQRLADDHAALNEQHRQLAEANNRLQGDVEWLASEKNAIGEQHQQLSDVNSRLQSDVIQLANEKAAADEQNRQLVEQKSQLQNEVDYLTNQRAELEAEREGLRRHNEQLLSEACELAGERGSLADERTSLCQERSELRQENEALRLRIAQLNEENSALAVGKLTLVEQRDAFNREAEQLQMRVAELSEENATLAAANATLAEEQARLAAEQKRLAELEREMGAAVAGRENTSAELYRALLQLAEMEERDEQNKAVIEAYESLSKEHNHLHEETDQLKEQLQRLSDERAAVEGAWQALSAEAATLGESQQRIADENATLLARLDEARQQLERAQQEQITSASSAAEVERERAAKLQAEAEIAAAIAEGEQRLAEQECRFAEQAQQFAEQSSQFNEQSRKHAEQAREFAESINMLERQLAAAGETRDSLARAREEAQLQLTEAESCREEQSRRIHELELQLAAAEERAAKAAELAANRSASGWKDAVAEPDQPAAERTESAPKVASEQPAEFRWSSARNELTSHDEPSARGGDDAFSWDRPASAADVWLNASASDAAPEEPNTWGKKVLPQVPDDASAFGEDDGASVAEQPVEDVASSGPSSGQSHAAAEPEITFGEQVLAKPEESIQQETKPESAAAKREPTSFIERYSYMFAEDGTASEGMPERSNELAQARPIVPVVTRREEAILAPKSEEEDSIEQYMAKLLQRVRGDSEGGKAAREQPTRMPLNAPTEKPVERSAGNSEPLGMAAPESRADGQVIAINDQPKDSGEPVKRRVSAPVPTTNLGALRALANETARLAISRHELRTLRRNAVTKTIVATLAGVTSLWLMLDSPDWLSIQFVTACGALLAAAYWACETCRTLLNSMRVSAYDGPEAGAGKTEAFESPALPIDVETRE